MTALALLGEEVGGFPASDRRFASLADDEGRRQMIEIAENKVVRIISDDGLEAAIKDYFTKKLCIKHPTWLWYRTSDLDRTLRFLRAEAPFIDGSEIAGVATKSHEGYAFHKLDYDLDSTKDFPTFKELFGRMTNAEAVMTWIGSLFDSTSDRSQLVYLFGEGNNGKGRLVEFLGTAFGAAHIESAVPRDPRFWTGSVYNKRLVTFGECDDFQFAVGETIKAVTGNDTVVIEKKGKDFRKATAVCKFLFASNVKPAVRGTEAHTRRVIFGEMTPYTGPHLAPSVYDKKLRDEGHAFLSHCWRLYKKNAETFGKIQVDAAMMSALVEENTAQFEELIDQYFALDPDLHVKSNQLLALLVETQHERKDLRQFRLFIENKYKARYSARRVDGHLIKGFWGLGLKGSAPIRCDAKAPKRPGGSLRSDQEWKELLARMGFGSGHSGEF